MLNMTKHKINPNREWLKLSLVFLFGAGMALAVPAAELKLQTEANVMVEQSFTASRSHSDPFNTVTLDVIFIDPKGRELRVPAFWAGANVWKMRYASPVVGTHRFHSECSDAQDNGLQGVKGRVEVKAYSGLNPLYIHGPLRVSENHRFLEHRDGTPFFWLGDTWWMGLSHRLHWPEDFQKLAMDRKEKGFNVIQIVAGLYPDMFPFDPRGANEAGYPWETNYTSIRPEYFDAVDNRLRYLVDQGFTPCLVGAWGYFMPWMGVDKMKAHWRYLIARYGALPVVWCAAGEANLPWYLAKGFPYDDRKQVSDWTEVMRFMRETDPFHRPITIHPTGIGRLSARHATDDVALIDIDMLQTPHGERNAVAPTVNTVRESYTDKPVMPVIDGEASYEMLGGTIKSEWTRQMFWLCLMNGAAGHTYGANGIWQVNRRGDPHGASPHGGNYGTIPWDDAMNLPGSRQVGLGKKLLEQYAWQDFQPHPQWAMFAGKSSLDLKDCNWIWYPEGNPAQNAPAEKRFFRRTIVVPEGKTIQRAVLRVHVDDKFEARLNGEKLGGASDWHVGRQFNELGRKLKPGTNVLAIAAENLPAGGPNPAGLIASFVIQYADGESFKMVSDAAWLCDKTAPAGWDAAGFDDSAWVKALAVGKYGDMPWGQIELPDDDAYAPQSAGIPGVVRITYVPQSRAILVRNLGIHTTYQATYFDPVGGAKTDAGLIHADNGGSWTCPAPPGQDHDWVLILEEKKEGAKKSDASSRLSLVDAELEWDLDWSDGSLKSSSFDNKMSGHRFALSGDHELALNFSAALDRVAQPFIRAADFEVRAAHRVDAHEAVFELHSPSLAIDVNLHFKLEGPTRRKWAEVKNHTGKELLLLDAELDDFTSDGRTTGGGLGQPVFIEDEAFAAIEHPSGMNNGEKGRVKLMHYPGRRLAAGDSWESQVALVSVAPAGKAFDHFLGYIQSKSRRGEKVMSIYTPFGINNQWGGCPTLNDEETLDVLNVVQRMQGHGVHFDFFTLDTGWVDPNSDLTRFRPTCYPNGPQKIIERVNGLGMKFGLWYPTSWAAESCWDYPPALAGQQQISLPYRLGYPDKAHEGRMLCIAQPAIFNTLSNAVIYAIKENHVRFVKLDGGSYVCDRPDHQHLPGVYATEQMHHELISLANSARAIAPDVRFMLYYGCFSPFWALHGDFIFESGVSMEGSATSAFPTLNYRDSVTLMQDEVVQYARNIPPLIKDSLGVWLADNRWGNFMGKDRWREALVMDLGRGNMLFPNLWGDLYLLDESDMDFLGRMEKLAKENERLFSHRRKILGDPWHNDVYGYAYCEGQHGYLFINNANFTARHAEVALDTALGLDAQAGAAVNVTSLFPDQTRLLRPDEKGFKLGDTLGVWMRPFEVLMLEVTPAADGNTGLPARSVTETEAAGLGRQLVLRPTSLDPCLEMRFADAARFEQKGMTKRTFAFETWLPVFHDDRAPVFAVTVRLRQGDKDWRYTPVLAEIVQALVKIGDQDVQLVPVPDGRQFGNTQSYGSSWITYKVRLGRQMLGKEAKLAVHAYLPSGVDAEIKA